MGKIKVLPDAVANQIAAGEVVERPASVVKELLENSLDAGSTDIRVEIEAGGRRLIRITDNGSGMMRDDAMLAFERHATSKLSSVHDLESIGTLGFRGEALPSIGSVSRLTLETHSRDESSGTRVEISGGKMIKCEDAGLAAGTILTIRDLFFNVPARKKFLRSEQTELAHIASLVTHYSLAHPDKSFELHHGPSELLRVTPVSTALERVFQVFGNRILEDLVEFGPETKSLSTPEGEQKKFSLSGFVSKPHIQKLNRNSIYLFVNGRLIRDKLLLHALTSAYHNLIPPACYPFALLFLDCDFGEVDVNVHPSKTEVRFRHSSFVHDFVRDAVRGKLMESKPVSSLPLPSYQTQPASSLPFSEFTQRIENTAPDYSEMVVPFPDGPPPEPRTLPNFRLDLPAGPPQRFDFNDVPQATMPPARMRIPDTHGPLPPGVASATEMESMGSLGDLRPIGQIHNSFIIAAGRDGLWIIDQHVAHERILFEQVLRQFARREAQQQRLLMPMVMELSVGQHLEYARIAEELARAGFETEPFGNRTIAIQAAPTGLGPGDIEKAIHEILDIAETELRKSSVEDLRRNIAASVACRAAIKINTPLDQQKMDYLLLELAKCEYPMACPHGRPIALRYSTRDILKGFHRI
ncbi:DNA mismatch repair endonuclease MutL [Bryobacter aggregatus]|uniref:DNA mismatch repair endonuclease MutL n=1 Tax=Bryobacter aggregatus TaxID=360054 RepID=UPI0004E276AB|nr:DNA mismatch repair endonuclease MutL [Bryobacter aggregatus]